MRKVLIFLMLTFFFTVDSYSQFTNGTTGLLNMPTADMQKDKTFLFGGSFLNTHTTPARWFYNTYNYYINITFLPWLEIGYTCTLHKAVANDPAYGGGYWVPSTYGKFVNQDRAFHGRIRIWKEGWWKSWTPQIVVGANDPTSGSWKGGGSTLSDNNNGNGYYSRFYLAISKHFNIYKLGEFGTHLAWIYNRRKDYKLNGLCIGTNFRFKLEENGSIWNKTINGVNFMFEAYPANGQGMYHAANLLNKDYKSYDRGVHIGKYDINIGACYSFWKERINLYGELYGCKDFSGGVQFKVHL